MMTALNLLDIANDIGAVPNEIAVTNKPSITFSSLSTDTRNISIGDLFVALQGPNFDGNKFVQQAANAGAVAAVVSKESDVQIPQLVCDDSRYALGVIARHNRRLFKGPVIALTGSAGKTTAKEMIANILAESGNVLATQGNLNNEIGVPLTLLSIKPEHQYAVIEMGASKQNDIRYLTQFSEPTVALLTNAKSAHIEGFGSLDGVAATKGQIFENLPEDGVAVINKDDVYFEQWRQQSSTKNIISFSKLDASASFYARNIQLTSTGKSNFILCGQGEEIAVSLSLLGEQNVTNAVAAAATASSVGATFQQIKAGLEKTEAVTGRMKAIELSDRLLIDDSYNANPDAVKAAIDVLEKLPGTRCLILGTMGELGEQRQSLHIDVARYARDKGVEQLITVGEFSDDMVKVFGANAKAYPDLKSLLPDVNSAFNFSVILVKGSRSAHMEKVVEALINKNNNKNNGDNQ